MTGSSSCPHCGSPTPDQSRFCGRCGADLGSPPAPVPVANAEPGPSDARRPDDTGVPAGAEPTRPAASTVEESSSLQAGSAHPAGPRLSGTVGLVAIVVAGVLLVALVGTAVWGYGQAQDLASTRSALASAEATIGSLQRDLASAKEQIEKLAGDPVSTVKAVTDAMQAKQWDKIADYACAAKKDEVAKQFNFAESLASSMPGVDTQKFSDALTIKFSNLDINEKSRTGDAAVVTMAGKIDLTIDPTQLKDLVRQALQASGQTNVTDEMITLALGAIGNQTSFSEDVSSDVNLVYERGKWLICE